MRALSTCNVLVVDDTETNIDILVKTLEDDFELKVAMDGESALESLTESLPDLILLDIMMPGMNGYEVMKRITADNRMKDIPVIFCTAMTEVEDEKKGLELGAVDYIHKPFSPPIVKARVRNHLLLKLAKEDLLKQNEILRENIRLREDVENITRHDLKTPLNAVINVPKLLIEEGNLNPDQVELLQMLEESGFRVLELVESSLDIYKMETKQYQLRPVPVDLLKLIKQIHGGTNEMVQQKKLAMSIMVRGTPSKPGDTFVVSGEEMICYSMLANLIKNAVEASPEGEKVTINLDDANGPLVTIHNKGVVPQEIRERFFDKYATSGKEGGTGLGTYSAKLIAETLGGRIGFETSAKHGTTLMVQFPTIESKAEEKPTRPATPALGKSTAGKVEAPPLSGKQSTVLIVDDYSSMRKTTTGILKQMGFANILEAADGRIAWNVLETVKVSLVISDWNMPNINGIELLRKVRATPSIEHIPFIMITGEANQENILESVKCKVSDYIIKPYSADTLKKKIEKYLRV